MRKIRTLVVDDEPLARARLLHLLQEYPDILLIGECGNGQEATTHIKKYRPDLVFLDIQMPDLDGFGVLEALQLDRTPFIIFVTAYDRFALKAFDIHAVDYLLKPFDDDRFRHALSHAREQIHINDQAVLNQKLLRVLDEFREDKISPPRNPDRSAPWTDSFGSPPGHLLDRSTWELPQTPCRFPAFSHTVYPTSLL